MFRLQALTRWIDAIQLCSVTAKQSTCINLNSAVVLTLGCGACSGEPFA